MLVWQAALGEDGVNSIANYVLRMIEVNSESHPGKTRLTPVLWFLAMGCIMVNIGLLPEGPSEFIQGLAELGIITIMFALGFEENSSHFVRSIKRSWGIALFGALAPFLVTYSLAMIYWDNVQGALMCALAMTATAVSLTMVTLRSEKLHTTKVATVIMTSAILDDVASLALVAVLVPLATGDATVSVLGLTVILVKTIVFFAIIAGMGLWLFPRHSGSLRYIPGFNNFSLKHLLALQEGEHATLIILLLALLVGLLGHLFGFHPAIGAYMAGLILKEEYFAFGEETFRQKNQIYRETRRIVDSVAFSWIGPIFFIVLGTRLILDLEMFLSVLAETLLLTLCLFTAQVLSAGLAARYTGKFSWHEAWMIGFGMLGRAELAFVVMNIAYVQNNILTEEMFYTLMFTAFWLNVSVPLTIRWWKPHFLKASREP